jgi:hypothetical protein
MKDLFDFSKTYAGTIFFNDKNFPCTLSFPDHHIVFKMIAEDLNYFLKGMTVFDFDGYVTTESGTMNFKAFKALQVYGSTNHTRYSSEHYQPDALMVTHINNDLNLSAFGQANILFDHLESIGRFVEIDYPADGRMVFEFQRNFEKINFYTKEAEFLNLQNPFHYVIENASKNIFSANIEPFFEYVPGVPITYNNLGMIVKELSWFIQLLFGSRQFATDLLVYPKPIGSTSEAIVLPYYFFNREMIKKKAGANIRVSVDPVFDVEELQPEIKMSFAIWKNFNKIQRKIYTLYYNEMDSPSHVRDDRFKNLAAIIQGLEAFCTIVKINDLKGDMYKKLRYACDDTLFGLIKSVLAEDLIFNLFEMMAVQRDHFQHLNKPLKFDLNEDGADMMAVNHLMKCMIRYHLLKAVKFPEDKVIKLIEQDLYYITIPMRNLQIKLKERYH